MTILLFYLASIISLLVGTAAIYMALIERFPISWLYYHYFIRKPLNWSIFLGLCMWAMLIYHAQNAFPYWAIAPVGISLLSLILTYKMHQETAFPAVDFPEIAKKPDSLPLDDDMEIAVIEYEGETRCYPLDYVIHHHIINDRFNAKTVALTYCAMCRSIIPFDVTAIGPLFVGSFKNANMIVADRKTKTFFQQATFKSIIGRLHPMELKMIPFRIMTWAEVSRTITNPRVVQVSQKDFRAFQLPIPGIWKKIVASESTPGLSGKNRDKTFPARTRVIGIIDNSLNKSLVYLKKDIMDSGIIVNDEHDFFIISTGKSIAAFKLRLSGHKLHMTVASGQIVDDVSGTCWDIRGKHRSGTIKENLDPIAISDEFWFSWKRFHPKTQIMA